jgi:HSP20 family molecular chaperone IbpA
MTTYLAPTAAAEPRRSTSSRRSLSRGREENTIVTPVPLPSAPAATQTRDRSAHRHSRHISLDSLARFVHTLGHQGTHDVVNPHFDLVEGRTSYTIYGELPGLDRDGVNVEVNDHTYAITISGLLWRPTPVEANGTTVHAGAPTEAPGLDTLVEGKSTDASYRGKDSLDVEHRERRASVSSDLHWHVTERRVGEFRRQFQFPFEMVEMHKVQAIMKDGLLTLTVPKQAPRDGLPGKSKRGRRLEIAAQAGTETTTGTFPVADNTVGAVL